MLTSEQNVPRWLPAHRSRTCRDDFIIGAEPVEIQYNYIPRMLTSEQNVPRWLPKIGAELVEMTLYKSEQTYFAAHLHRILRLLSSFFPLLTLIYSGAREERKEDTAIAITRKHAVPTEMTLYHSAQNYIADHLLHGCTRAHQTLLPSYPALPSQFRSRCPVAQPMSRFDIQVLGFSTVYTLPCPNQPLCTRLLFADCRPLHITKRYKFQGFVTSSRDATLPTRVITVSFLWLQCTIDSSTPPVQSLSPVPHVSVGLFICLLFVVYLLNIFNFHWSYY